MEYGVRHYEAMERLRWFLLLLVCLLLAYPLASSYTIPPTWEVPLSSFRTAIFTSPSFYIQLPWFRVQPLGAIMIYLTCLGALFILVRTLLLLLQAAGRLRLKTILNKHISRKSTAISATSDHPPTGWNRLFPADILLLQIDRTHLQLAFHPFRRVRLLLSNPQGFPTSESLMEKEHRASEVDWEVLHGSWSPFGWILWSVPLLAFLQTGWLLHEQVAPALSGQIDVHEVLTRASSGLLPFAQALAAVIALSLSSGLLKRMESLYLSSLNALIYDCFLSKLPVQSGDTLILLEAFQKNFQELQSMLRRLERSMNSTTDKGP